MFHSVVLLDFLARQASEQYNTESQFLAQALRQVMVRPHTAHNLLGSDCLLPLKSFFIEFLNPVRQTSHPGVTGQRLLPCDAAPTVVIRFCASHVLLVHLPLRRALPGSYANHTCGL